MQVREYTDGDLEQLRRLHSESGFGYTLPALSGEEFFSRRVVSHKEGIAMAAFLRHTAEAFLICDPTWRTAAWRELALRNLQTACRHDAGAKGISEVNAFLPPKIEKQFGRRLLRLGWKHYVDEEWRCYSVEV